MKKKRAALVYSAISALSWGLTREAGRKSSSQSSELHASTMNRNSIPNPLVVQAAQSTESPVDLRLFESVKEAREQRTRTQPGPELGPGPGPGLGTHLAGRAENKGGDLPGWVA